MISSVVTELRGFLALAVCALRLTSPTVVMAWTMASP